MSFESEIEHSVEQRVARGQQLRERPTVGLRIRLFSNVTRS